MIKLNDADGQDVYIDPSQIGAILPAGGSMTGNSILRFKGINTSLSAPRETIVIGSTAEIHKKLYGDVLEP